MGKPFMPFFGDNTKAELEKEIAKIDNEITKLEKKKAELMIKLEELD